MKPPRVFGVVVAVSGCLLLSSCAETLICGRMETLCGTTRQTCADLVKQTRQVAGDEGVDGLKACFAEANSCSEASGCVAGKGLKAAGAAVGDFFKGLVKGTHE